MFNLGQTVYWIEDVREQGKLARVRVRSANFMTARHNGDTIAVIDDSGHTFFLYHNPALFTKCEDATTFAFGRAVRLVTHFAYEVVEVTDHMGRLHVLPATQFKVENGKAPV